MNTHPQVEITVYENRHCYKSERRRNINWLQTAMPVVMQKQKMVADEFYLAPLGQAVMLCLS